MGDTAIIVDSQVFSARHELYAGHKNSGNGTGVPFKSGGNKPLSRFTPDLEVDLVENRLLHSSGHWPQASSRSLRFDRLLYSIYFIDLLAVEGSDIEVHQLQ